MEKYDILTELLSRFYGGNYENIKHTTKEDSESYRVNFGDSVSLTLNTLADCVYLNVSFKHADALAFLNDVQNQYVEKIRKDKYEKGYDAGYDKGYEDGKNTDSTADYTKGYSDGYKKGKEDAKASSNNSSKSSL